MVRVLAFACLLLAIPAAPWRLAGRLLAQTGRGPQHVNGDRWMADAVLGHLVAAWAFDEGGGTVASDATGNGHHGTVVGATWTPDGRYGGALAFDGDNDQVLIAAHSALELSSDFTLTAWIRPAALGRWQTIYQNGPGNGSWGLYLADDDAMTFTAFGHAGLDGPTVTSTEWHHVAWVRHGTGPVSLLMLVDGEASAINQAPALAPSGMKRIGGDGWNGVDFFEGLIDNVRLYNTALSPAQVHADMNNGVAATPELIPPTVTVSAPASGSHLSDLVLVSASAADNVWVEGVQFFLGPTPLGPEDTSAPFEVVWDTASVAEGPYMLRARARDLIGNTGWSDPVPVTVVNASPDIVLSTASDLACGVATDIAITELDDGELRLPALLEDDFEGAALDTAKWAPDTFDDYDNAPVVANGEVSVDHAWIHSIVALPADLDRVAFEGRVRFADSASASAFTDVGFGDPGDPLGAPNILFVSDDQGRLFANTNHPDQDGPDRVEIAGVNLDEPHDLRLTVEDWRTVHFYVDGVHRHSQVYATPVFTGNVHLWFLAQWPESGRPMHGEWLRIARYDAASGVYSSCAQDAGASVAWTTMSWDAALPAGTTAIFRTRTSLDGSTWSSWSAPVPANGAAITSPNGRFIQVRVELGTSDALLSPEVRSITMRHAPP